MDFLWFVPWSKCPKWYKRYYVWTLHRKMASNKCLHDVLIHGRLISTTKENTMDWKVAIIDWNDDNASLFIQTDDDRVFTLKVASVDKDVIADAISTTFNVPRQRVIYNDTKYTMYRRMSYMTFLVME